MYAPCSLYIKYIVSKYTLVYKNALDVQHLLPFDVCVYTMHIELCMHICAVLTLERVSSWPP